MTLLIYVCEHVVVHGKHVLVYIYLTICHWIRSRYK